MKSRLPQGMQGGNANMNQMVRKAQKMQEEITRVQDELEQKEFTKQVGGGVLEIVMTGDKKLKSITIKPEAVDPNDVEMLQDLIISGVNETIQDIEDYGAAEMEKVTGGVTMPGLI